MTTPGDFHTGSQRGSAHGNMGGMQDEGVTEKARRMAGEAGEKAVDTIESNVDRGKNRLANTLHSFADALRRASSDLREDDPNAPNDFIERAAGQVDRLSSFVQGQDLRHTTHDLENFARRQPALFLGGAFLLGVAGARFLKSSQRADEEYASGYPQSGGYAQRGYGSTVHSTGRPGYGAGAYAGGSLPDPEIGGRRERGWSEPSPADVSLRGGRGMSSGLGGTGSSGSGAGGMSGTDTSRSAGKLSDGALGADRMGDTADELGRSSGAGTTRRSGGRSSGSSGSSERQR